MANFTEVVKIELRDDEKTWFSFANLGLASIVDEMDKIDVTALVNTQTGEFIDDGDIRHAYNTLEFLLDGNLEVLDD